MEQSNIQIRLAGVSDAGLVHSFIRKLAAYERLSDSVRSTEADISRMLKGDFGAHAVLAFEDGQPVGFAVFYMTFSTFSGRLGLFLEDIFVDEERRGIGVGWALMRWLSDYAAGHDCDRISWFVLDWNLPARGFYEKLGAATNAPWLPYILKEDAMKRLSGRENRTELS